MMNCLKIYTVSVLAAEDALKRICSLGTLANQVAGTTSISNKMG